MSTANEKDSPIGLTVTRPSAAREYSARDNVLSTIEDVESTHSLTPIHAKFPQSSVREPSPSASFSHDNTSTEYKNSIAVYETDVEVGLTNSTTNVLSPYSTMSKSPAKPCTMWPGRKQLQDRRNAMRMSKGWHPLARFDKTTRILIKIAIGLFLTGCIIAVGVGISKAVGGGIWDPSAHT